MHVKVIASFPIQAVQRLKIGRYTIKPAKIFKFLSEFLVKSFIIEKSKILPIDPIKEKIREQETKLKYKLSRKIAFVLCKKPVLTNLPNSE